MKFWLEESINENCIRLAAFGRLDRTNLRIYLEGDKFKIKAENNSKSAEQFPTLRASRDSIKIHPLDHSESGEVLSLQLDNSPNLLEFLRERKGILSLSGLQIFSSITLFYGDPMDKASNLCVFMSIPNILEVSLCFSWGYKVIQGDAVVNLTFPHGMQLTFGCDCLGATLWRYEPEEKPMIEFPHSEKVEAFKNYQSAIDL